MKFLAFMKDAFKDMNEKARVDYQAQQTAQMKNTALTAAQNCYIDVAQLVGVAMQLVAQVIPIVAPVYDPIGSGRYTSPDQRATLERLLLQIGHTPPVTFSEKVGAACLYRGRLKYTASVSALELGRALGFELNRLTDNRGWPRLRLDVQYREGTNYLVAVYGPWQIPGRVPND